LLHSQLFEKDIIDHIYSKTACTFYRDEIILLRILYRSTNKKTCQQAGFDARGLSLFLDEIFVFFLKLLDPALRIDYFLRSRIKGMAGGTDLKTNGGAGRFCFEYRTASTADFDIVVFRMYGLFQWVSSLYLKEGIVA